MTCGGLKLFVLLGAVDGREVSFGCPYTLVGSSLL